jgi:hypothetical protein
MPTMTARIGRERTLTGLARNLFVFDGPDPRADLRRAERALLTANPELRDSAAFRAGAAVVVPPGLRLRTTERVEMPAADIDGAVAEAEQRVRDAAVVLREAFGQARSCDKRSLERLGDPRFMAELERRSPDAAKLAPAARQSLVAELEMLESLSDRFTGAIETALSDLAALQDRDLPKP